MVRHSHYLIERTLMACRTIKVSDQYSLSDLCSMTEEDMEALLGFYKPGTVPSLDALRPQKVGGAFNKPFLI